MGIFSSACENPDCKARIPKKASFCAKCGWAGPNSLTTCGDCHKHVGRNNAYCWNCGADIAEAAAPRIVGNRWVRQTGEFAARVLPEDIDGSWLSKRVTVEAGTFGVIERNGKIIGKVEDGVQTLQHLVQLAPMSIHLVSAGDAVLRPTFRGLRDARNAELDVTLQLVFQVSDYEAFVRQFFEGHRRRVTFQMLEDRLAHELHDVVRALLAHHTLDDMYGNLQWRDEIEAQLRGAMAATLQRFGLQLLQLNFVEFGGDDYEATMERRGEVYMGNIAADHLAEKLAIQHRMAELTARGKLDTETTDKELADQIAELNKTYGVRHVLRESELLETVAQARHEQALRTRLRTIELEDMDERVQRERREREMELETLTTAHQNDLALTLLVAQNKRTATEDEYRRERDKLNQEQDLAFAKAEAAQRNQLLVESARAFAQAEREKLEADLKRLEIEGISEEAKLDRKMRYERHLQEMKEADHRLQLDAKRLEQEELKLVLNYKLDKTRIKSDVEKARYTSEDAARAAAAEARSEEKDKFIESLKDGQKQIASLAENLVDKFTRASQQPSVIFAGPGGVTPVGGGSQQTAPCPKCQKPVPVEYAICPHCGTNITGR